MRVLITGGAGYIGYSLVQKLMEDMDHVEDLVILDNLSRKNYAFFTEAKFNNNIRFIQGDVLDGRLLQKALDGIDVVVHLAAKVTTPYADAEAHAFDQVNHWGTAQLTQAIEQAPSVKRVIYLSSISVFGAPDEQITDSTVPRPQSFYGISKYDGEQQLRLLQGSREVIILRSGNVYGYNPSYRIDAVINRFLFNANFVGRVQINGSGEQSRAFVHVAKVANTIRAAVRGDIPAGTFNVVEHNFTINAIAEEIRNLYPALESIHVNYNIRMRDVHVTTPCPVWQYVPLPEKRFTEELKDFKQQFSF